MPELQKITRWTAVRKAAVLREINQGELTPALAHSLYGISAEELETWRTRIAAGGIRALAEKNMPRLCAPAHPKRRDGAGSGGAQGPAARRLNAVRANQRDGDQSSDFTISTGETVTIIINPARKPRIVNAAGTIREVDPGWEGDMIRGTGP